MRLIWEGDAAVLTIDNVSVAYGRVPALFGISLEIREGEIVALVGSNGAGKSTTLKTISGLLRPSAGSIQFRGERLDGLPPQKITARGIAYVPEGRHIFPGMTVIENLELAGIALGYPGRQIKADVERILESFPNLRQRARQHAWSLSGGEQQMLAIGRGLIARPKLLMLDEPSLGLAPRLVIEVFDTISNINSQGTTIFLVEQNASLALEIAHRGYVLEVGRVALSGSGRELLNTPMVQESYLGGNDDEGLL